MNVGMNVSGVDPESINPRAKYNQKDAAALLGKDVSTLYRWNKSGKFCPKWDKRLKRYVYEGSALRSLVG